MGKEQPAEFYDLRLRSPKYQNHYVFSPQLPLWKTAYLCGIAALRVPAVFEVGCGTGQFARMLQELGVRNYLGIDFSEVAIRTSRRQADFEFQKRDLHDLRAEDFDGFNVVVALEVLEHVEKDLELLEKIPSHMRVVLSVPKYDDEGHVRFFNNVGEVRERYSPLIGSSKIYKIVDGRWFLMVGKRK